jgi:hypothetical protein
MSSNEKIEPPYSIYSEREGLMIIMTICDMLDEMVIGKNRYNPDGSARPVVGMLYLEFTSELKANQWNESFRVLINHHWINKLRKESPLHIIALSKKNSKNTLDVFFAESDDVVWDIASMRFEGQLLNNYKKL